MKKFTTFLFILISFFPIGSIAQMRWNQQYQDYIDLYKDIAIEEMKKHHIPASITLAQGLFESRAGMSKLAVYGNNHFGIKCHGWTGRTVKHNDDAPNECFRAYSNALESYEDHSKFLRNNSRYHNLFLLSEKDYKGWAYGLKACGYATNPKYPNKLIEIIELYNLHKYDYARSYDKFMVERSKKEHYRSFGEALHRIYYYNKNYYVIAKKGDSFQSISDELDIPSRALARYNERDRNDVLLEGDIIFLKRKQKRADKKVRNKYHIVQTGESLYSISQKYAIRLKSLYKKNHFNSNYMPTVGDKIKL